MRQIQKDTTYKRETRTMRQIETETVLGNKQKQRLGDRQKETIRDRDRDNEIIEKEIKRQTKTEIINVK